MMTKKRTTVILISLILAVLAVPLSLFSGATLELNAAEKIQTKFVGLSPDFVSNTVSVKFNNIKLSESDTDNCNILISGDTGINNSKDRAENYFKADTDKGYTKTVIAYSPIVAIFPDDIVSKKENFSVTSSNTTYYYMTDMKVLLEAFADSKDGTIRPVEYGFSTRVEKVKLGIPDSGNSYKIDTIKAIIYILTDGKDVTSENVEEIRGKLENILGRATYIKNPVNSLGSSDVILLVPEYLSNETQRVMKPVYWNNMYSAQVVAFISNEIPQEKQQIILEKLKGTEQYQYIGYRNESKLKTLTKNKYFARYIPMVYGQENLDEFIDIETLQSYN